MNTSRRARFALVLLCLLPCLLLFAPRAGATVEPESGLSDQDIARIIDGLTRESDTGGNPLDILTGDAPAEQATGTVEILLLLTVLTLAPSILIMVTAFTRIVIVLSFTRNAMGTQQMPPNQVMVGLALFLAFFVMYPIYTQVVRDAWEPYQAGEIETLSDALDRAKKPVRDFMIEQIDLQGNQNDLRSFMSLAQIEELPETVDEIPTHVLIPAFVVSEIKTAFQIGFMIYIPFIVIDMIVASALMSMGMMMLPPVMISLPFKIMLFVLVDGWNLTITSLVRTFQR